MKFTDTTCPSCGAKAGFQCENLVKFRNKETGEMKLEWRVSETHKARKTATIMDLLRERSLKLLADGGKQTAW